MTSKVLVVGAGAVGQVLAVAFAKSGCEVGFFLRPGAAAASSLTLRVSRLPMRVLAQWRGHEWRCSCRAYDSVDAAIVDGPWDAVVLAVAA
eukprot:5485329-Prymnesium_polylepis.1